MQRRKFLTLGLSAATAPALMAVNSSRSAIAAPAPQESSISPLSRRADISFLTE